MEVIDVVESKCFTIVSLEKVDWLDVLLPSPAEAALHANEQAGAK
jgi:hypothetical protein